MTSNGIKGKHKPEAGGLFYKNNRAIVGLMNIPSRPGIGGQLFSAVDEAGIHVDLIVNMHDRKERDHIVLCVDLDQLDSVLDIARQVQDKAGGEALIHDPDMALVCISSANFGDSQTIAGHMFKALGDHNINIHGISSSVSTITCLLKSEDLDTAVTALRNTFIFP